MKVTRSPLTLCNPMECRLPGSSVGGILQARMQEWVAIPFSRWYSQPRDWNQVSCTAGKREREREIEKARERKREKEREREWLGFRRVVHMCSKTIFNHPNQLAATACTVLFQYWLTVTQAPGWKYASLIGLYLNQELRFVLCFWHHGKWLAVRAVDDFLLESLPDT